MKADQKGAPFCLFWGSVQHLYLCLKTVDWTHTGGSPLLHKEDVRP